MGQGYLATKYLASEAEHVELMQQWESAALLNDQANQSNLNEPFRFSTVFYPKGCYSKVSQGEENYDEIYCTGNTVILVAAFVNTVIVSMLLFIHIKANYQALSFIELFTKVKTTMLILMILLQLSVVVRYAIDIDNDEVYDFILIGS